MKARKHNADGVKSPEYSFVVVIFFDFSFVRGVKPRDTFESTNTGAKHFGTFYRFSDTPTQNQSIWKSCLFSLPRFNVWTNTWQIVVWK